MTIGELKTKLAKYSDDTEIFTYYYDDLCCQDAYYDPFIQQEDVRTYTTKRGFTGYTKHGKQPGSKQHTVLVIG